MAVFRQARRRSRHGRNPQQAGRRPASSTTWSPATCRSSFLNVAAHGVADQGRASSADRGGQRQRACRLSGRADHEGGRVARCRHRRLERACSRRRHAASVLEALHRAAVAALTSETAKAALAKQGFIIAPSKSLDERPHLARGRDQCLARDHERGEDRDGVRLRPLVMPEWSFENGVACSPMPGHRSLRHDGLPGPKPGMDAVNQGTASMSAEVRFSAIASAPAHPPAQERAVGLMFIAIAALGTLARRALSASARALRMSTRLCAGLLCCGL